MLPSDLVRASAVSRPRAGTLPSSFLGGSSPSLARADVLRYLGNGATLPASASSLPVSGSTTPTSATGYSRTSSSASSRPILAAFHSSSTSTPSRLRAESLSNAFANGFTSDRDASDWPVQRSQTDQLISPEGDEHKTLDYLGLGGNAADDFGAVGHPVVQQRYPGVDDLNSTAHGRVRSSTVASFNRANNYPSFHRHASTSSLDSSRLLATTTGASSTTPVSPSSLVSPARLRSSTVGGSNDQPAFTRHRAVTTSNTIRTNSSLSANTPLPLSTLSRGMLDMTLSDDNNVGSATCGR